MSHITKAYDGIKLAATEVGGVGALAARVGMNVDTARRLVKRPTEAIENLQRLEEEAAKILGERMP